MMPFAAVALGLVTGLGPRTVTDGASGELMKALAQELWASAAEVDGGVFTALFAAGPSHRSDASNPFQDPKTLFAELTHTTCATRAPSKHLPLARPPSAGCVAQAPATKSDMGVG